MENAGLVGISAVIGAGISAIVVKMNNDSNNKLKYVTEERGKWRTNIRDNVKSIVTSTDEKQIEELIAELEMSLNPIDKEDIAIVKCAREHLKYINSSDVSEKRKKNEKSNKTELLKRVSLLLKHDWERVKVEANPMKFFPNVVSWMMYAIASAVVVGLFNFKCNFNLNEIFKNEASKFFLYSNLLALVFEILLVIFVLKIVVKSLKKCKYGVIENIVVKIKNFLEFPRRITFEECKEMNNKNKKYDKLIEENITNKNMKDYDCLYNKIKEKYNDFLNECNSNEEKTIRINKEKNRMKILLNEYPIYSALQTVFMLIITAFLIAPLSINVESDNSMLFIIVCILKFSSFGLVLVILGYQLYKINRVAKLNRIICITEKVLDDLLMEIDRLKANICSCKI